MKKILALVLAVLMIAGSMVSVAAFDDVAADDKYAKAIEGLQSQKVVAGTTETTFSPDALVTRWQMALFMARSASGIVDDAQWQVGAELFTDCTQYLGAIQYCYSMGIIKGTTDTTFSPDANITLRDGLIMAVRALGYEKEDEGLEASAKKYNVTGANYWVPYYQKANELGLLDNLTDLSIVAPLTRAQTAQLIYNMLYTKVYAKTGNDNKYTLNDVAFGGKKIVEVENSKNAWVIETPKYFIGTSSDVDEDDEYIVIAFVDDNGNVDTVDVSFDDLEKYGIDTAKVDEYFGATVDIINYTAAESRNDVNDYADFEYLTNFEKVAAAELTDADFTFNDDGVRVKIGSKTHYAADEDKTNTITLYTVNNASEELDDVTFSEIDFADIDGKFFDAKAYDVDNDGYYEYAFINPAYIDSYVEASAKGVEKYGVMNGVEGVTYSETLVEDDVIVYTYDAFANAVTVKAVIEVNEGKVTAYSQKTEKVDGENVVTGYVTIDGTKYTIEDSDVEDLFYAVGSLGDIDLATAEELRTASKANMSSTYEYYTFNGRLIAFGDEAEEEQEVINYAIVKDFTDFELNEYVVMTAIIDGAETDIKVNKIYEWDAVNGKWKLTHDIAKMGYSKLATALDDIAGIYTYTVDDDGMYKLKARGLEYDIADYISDEAVESGALVFSSGKAINAIDRHHMIRLAADTKIYLVSEEDDEIKVETVKAKTSGTFSIPVAADTKFYADKVGYGDPDDDCDIEHGVTSVLYISANGDAFDADNYSVVFVESDIETVSFDSAKNLGIDDDDDDATYAVFTADGNALLLSTLKSVDVLYQPKANVAPGNALVAGVYLVNADGVIVGAKELADITEAGNYVFELANGKVGFVAIDLTADGIDLYTFNDIRIPALGLTGAEVSGNLTDDNKAGVKTLQIRDYEVEDGEIVAVATKTNAKAVKYLEDNYADGALAIVLGNDPSDRNSDGKFTNDWVAYPVNTINAVIIDNLLA